MRYFDWIKNHKPYYVIFDRTPICDNGFYTLETVHEPIYEAKYALKVFTIDELNEALGSKYKLVYADEASVPERFCIENALVIRRFLVYVKI